MRPSTLKLVTVAVSATAIFVLAPPTAKAYPSWTAGCVDCHSSFTDDVAIRPGDLWPDKKHVVHRNSMLDSLCGACHVTNGDDPLMNSSAGETGLPGKGCVGCHGVDPTPGTPNSYWGAGLRLHHANASVGSDGQGYVCADCHDADPAPPPERTKPAYYGLAGVNVLSACNSDGTESWTSNGKGLDNDGDLLYDAADPDCPLFADGFESAGTTRWSAAAPGS